MAVLAAIATGSATNLTAAGTWGVVDSTSYLNSETGSELLTTAYSGTRTAAFTPGAITIDGIGIKLSSRVGTTGTISVNLEKDSDDSQVSGTEVTINLTDLPAGVTADLNGGWIFFKFAAPVTLAGATAYQVAAKTSTGSMINLFRDGTTDNFSRYLRTTTTQAPTTGDDMIIAGEWTAAATRTLAIVTQNNTASTDFGAASTSLVLPALSICDGGSLVSGVTAATAYLLKISGNIIVYAGGTLSLGTSGTRIPADSTSTILFDCGANVDFGLTVRNLGIMNAYGDNGRLYYTLLNTDEASTATVIGCTATTGWRVSDVLAFASTTRTAADCESKIILTVDSATQVTLTAGLTNAHSGTSPTQAEVINLTRNVLIQGSSDTLQAYIDIKATAVVNWSYAEFYRLGSGTANKRGIDVATTTGTFVADKCSFHDFIVASSVGINQSGVSGQTTTTMAVTSCVFYLIANAHYVNTATTGSWSIANSVFIRNTDAMALINITDVGGIIDGVVVVGCAITTQALSLSQVGGTLLSGANITVHSNAGYGLVITTSVCTLSNVKLWRNSGVGFRPSGAGVVTITDGLFFGNTASHVNFSSNTEYLLFDNCIFAGDTTFATTSGIQINGVGLSFGTTYFTNCTFGVVAGIYTAHSSGDINVSSAATVGRIYLTNCVLASSTEVATPGNLIGPITGIFSQRHDQTNGSHKAWVPGGIITTDITFYNTASPSMRMTPSSASLKMASAPLGMGMKYAGNSGATITVSVYIRKSASGDGAAYDGAQPRLIVRSNDAVGITADTVLATYSAATGSWNQLSGTTAALSDDGVVEIYVDCDGTAGWINLDDWGV